ncbi:MAG: bifunctional hydroxymethylpyrimidine kinase/phosphomethylpyrimidine kinase [Verrucomicrobia bacterium]|nr:MAG: bifunctional hydroxymethylpyrimidine kinase/phosphomethylpyrimidine kinase [Verrucomicrobiota bacterium]
MPGPRPTPVALSVAGSDSGGGAGVQADLLTFAALGVYGTTAITCVTAQNPDSVSAVHAVPARVIGEQMRQVAAFFRIGAMKTGMLLRAAIIREVARFLAEHPRLPVVVDPVMVATSGARLLQQDAIRALADDLLPRASLITPNLDEAAVLLGSRPQTPDELKEAAAALASRFGTAVLLKGGHLSGDRLFDVLARPGHRPRLFRGSRIKNVDTHGSGCTLSAAITALLARDATIEEAVVGARRYLRQGMTRPVFPGHRRFIAH